MSSRVILNVDQNHARRNRTARVLSEGYSVLPAAASKEECLRLAALHQPEIVLLPWELAGIEGMEICALLKNTLEAQPLVILRVPASPGPDLAERLASCRSDAFLPDRASDALIQATVASLLRLRDSRPPPPPTTPDAARVKEDASRFAARVSHDLAEPLRMMTTFGQMLGEDSADRLTADEKTYLGYVLGGVERARQLLQYMLEYSRVGADPSAHGPVSLSLVATLAVNGLKKRVEEAGAAIQVEEPLPTVWGSAPELQKVLQGLIGNALKYRRPDVSPMVTIKAVSQSPMEWLISVADNGIGIPPRFHESIFQPFERLHGKEIPGCGMGLPLAKRILESQSGRIWVESEPGQGANFFFTLPARED